MCWKISTFGKELGIIANRTYCVPYVCASLKKFNSEIILENIKFRFLSTNSCAARTVQFLPEPYNSPLLLRQMFVVFGGKKNYIFRSMPNRWAFFKGNVHTDPGIPHVRAPQAPTCDFNTHESYGDKILRDEIYMPILLKNQKFVAGRKFCEKNAGSE